MWVVPDELFRLVEVLVFEEVVLRR